MNQFRLLSPLLLAAAAAPALAAPLPSGWTTNGVAGTFTTADGVITLAPGFTAYQWVATTNGTNGGGALPVSSPDVTTNGATMSTGAFTVAAGDRLSFYFNYVTSDGSGFSDYAWAALFGASGFDRDLFTARTTPTGDTVPGFALPGLGAGVTLAPASTPIIADQTTFSPLGGDSGGCFNVGCGYTGWIQMDYTFTTGGVYSLGFGVSNAIDSDFGSAFAVAGVAINDVPVDNGGGTVPVPATLLLAGIGLAALAAARRRT